MSAFTKRSGHSILCHSTVDCQKPERSRTVHQRDRGRCTFCKQENILKVSLTRYLPDDAAEEVLIQVEYRPLRLLHPATAVAAPQLSWQPRSASVRADERKIVCQCPFVPCVTIVDEKDHTTTTTTTTTRTHLRQASGSASTISSLAETTTDLWGPSRAVSIGPASSWEGSRAC